MGRIKYLCRSLQHHLINLIPYKWRRPFILYFSVLGLIAYYNFAVYFSYLITGTENKILIGIGNAVTYIISVIKQFDNQLFVIFLFILLIIYITYKYCLVEDGTDKLTKQNTDKENNFNQSWYYQINGIISLEYALITILTLLHMFWR